MSQVLRGCLASAETKVRCRAVRRVLTSGAKEPGFASQRCHSLVVRSAVNGPTSVPLLSRQQTKRAVTMRRHACTTPARTHARPSACDAVISAAVKVASFVMFTAHKMS